MRDTILTVLDHRGLMFVREHLAGVNKFCAALLEVVDEEIGEAFTIAPRGVEAERLHAFREGGLLPENLDFSRAITLPDGQGVMMPVESLRAERVQWARGELRKQRGAVCIVDDYNPSWGDACLAETPTAFGVGEEVYHRLGFEDDDETFENVIASGNTIWRGVVAICRRSPGIDRHRLASHAEIRDCAHSVVEFTCSAYDGEGFVGWRCVRSD